MNISVEKMKPLDINNENFPKNEKGEINPFHQDLYHMGQPVGTGLMMMYANHPNEKCNYLILVDTETGERVKIKLDNKQTSQTNDIIPDHQLSCVWKCPDCPEQAEVTPDWYEQNGTPVCPKCNIDMEYLHTELLKN